jgi:hypothetical protein
MPGAITSRGFQTTTAALTGTPTVPAFVGWGYNPQGIFAQSTDVALFQEAPENRVSASVSVITTTTYSDTILWLATMTASAARVIAEVIVVDNTTKPFTGTISSNAGSTIIGSTTATGLVVNGGYTGTPPAAGECLQLDTGEVVQLVSGSGTSGSPWVVNRGANNSTANPNAAAGTNITWGAVPGDEAQSLTGAQVFLHADITPQDLDGGDTIVFNIQAKCN